MLYIYNKWYLKLSPLTRASVPRILTKHCLYWFWLRSGFEKRGSNMQDYIRFSVNAFGIK